MTKKSPLIGGRERKDAQNKNNPPSSVEELRERFRQIVNRITQNDVKARYELAKLVRDVLASDENRYGAHAIANLAEEHNFDETTLREYALVPDAWTEEEFTVVAERTMKNGNRLTWSHFVALAHAKSNEERQELLERVCNESLSVRALKEAMRKPADDLEAKRDSQVPEPDGAPDGKTATPEQQNPGDTDNGGKGEASEPPQPPGDPQEAGQGPKDPRSPPSGTRQIPVSVRAAGEELQRAVDILKQIDDAKGIDPETRFVLNEARRALDLVESCCLNLRERLNLLLAATSDEKPPPDGAQQKLARKREGKKAA